MTESHEQLAFIARFSFLLTSHSRRAACIIYNTFTPPSKRLIIINCCFITFLLLTLATLSDTKYSPVRIPSNPVPRKESSILLPSDKMNMPQRKYSCTHNFITFLLLLNSFPFRILFSYLFLQR